MNATAARRREARRREGREHPPPSGGPSGGRSIGGVELPVHAAAVLSVVSALAYLWALPMESVLWWGYGLFFLGAALVQGVYGVLILRWPVQRLFVAGICLNLALLSLFVVWYADGIPFGPHTGMQMEPHRPDFAGAIARAGLVVALVSLLEGKLRARTINAVLVLGAISWVFVLAGAFA